MDSDQEDSVRAIKRTECIADVIANIRDPIISIFMDIWEDTYKDPKVTKTKWLQQFQLSLKQVKELTDEDLANLLENKKRTLSCLYAAIMHTAYIHHDGSKPHLVKEKPLLFHFVRDTTVEIARELWTKPYLLFNITHKKTEVAAAREALEKLVAAHIRRQIREFTSDIVVMENERQDRARELLAAAPAPQDIPEGSPVPSEPQSPQHPAYLTQPLLESPMAHQVPPASRCSSVISDSAPGSPPHVPKFDELAANTEKTIDLEQLQQRLPQLNLTAPYSQHASPIPSPPLSVKSVNINKPESPRNSIDHMDYIPLRASSAPSIKSVSSTKSLKTKSIIVNSPPNQSDDEDTNSYSSSSSSSLSSSSVSSLSSSSSSSSDHSVIKRKKWASGMEKYRGKYGTNPKINKLIQKKKKKQGKKPTFF